MVFKDTDALPLHICTFLAWTSGVAIITWFICRSKPSASSSTNASDEYFAGGRSLKWYVCAGSLMLTNLSTEQMVGLNGMVFADGCLAGIWWEAGAALAMIVTATVFLPKYFALGLTTTSGFLGERFDLTLRTMVSLIFLVYYAVVLCPLVLYTGALAIRDIFDLTVPLWIVSLAIGTLGAAYALFGGLKAVAVSDCLNGVGLLVAGLWVPIAAMQVLPGGLPSLFEDGADHLKPLVARSMMIKEGEDMRSLHEPSVPWHVTLTGLALGNLYYWSTNQVIVQRVLAAESLSNGQKGVLFAALMKVVGFTFLCMPGIIGIMFVQQKVEINGKPFVVDRPDEVYPHLVKAVMPTWSLGFFSAVLLGSVLSTFNSALNSASTIFGLEIYKIYINKESTDRQVVRMATIFGASLALLSFVIAPQLVHVGGIFNFLQRMNSIVSLPIVTVFFIGIAASLPDAFSAKMGFFVGVLAIGLGQLVQDLQFLHLFFVCFCIASGTMALTTYLPRIRTLLGKCPRPVPYECSATGVVDMTPWRPMYVIAAGICVLLTMLIISLQFASYWLFLAFWGCWLATLGLLLRGKTTGGAKSKEAPEASGGALDVAAKDAVMPQASTSTASSSNDVAEGHAEEPAQVHVEAASV